MRTLRVVKDVIQPFWPQIARAISIVAVEAAVPTLKIAIGHQVVVQVCCTGLEYVCGCLGDVDRRREGIGACQGAWWMSRV